MIFSNREHQIDDLFIAIGPISIQNEIKYKLLGVTIDNILAFGSHVNSFLSKASKTVGFLCRLRNCLPHETRMCFYHSFTCSNLSYNLSVWGRAN